MRRLLVAAPAALLLLSGCASDDPVAERRTAVASVTDAANDRDVDGLRDAVSDLLSVLREQVANNEVDRAEADRLRAIADRIAASAPLLEPEPSPSPTPEETEEPSPSPSPSPSPTPEETEEPEPTEEPEETEEPEPTEEPEETEEPAPVIPTIGQSPTTESVSAPGGGPSSTSPAASPQPTA